MEIVFLTFGAAGDVLPVIALAEEARSRGHSSAIATESRWLGALHERGLPAIDLGEREGDAGAESGSLSFLSRVAAPMSERAYRVLCRRLSDKRLDALVGHHIAFATPWLARAAGVPWAMVAVAPASWTSLEQVTTYPGMPERDHHPDWYMRPAVALGSALTSRVVDPAVNRVRQKLGLAPGKRVVFDEMFSGARNLGLWSPEFRPPAGDDAPGSVVCGFPPAAKGTGLSRRVQAFLSGGAAPIVVTMGTSIPGGASRVVERAVKAGRALGRRVLVLGREGEPDRGRDVNAVCFSRFEPIEAVLPKAAAIVHHGGLGTVGAALRAGRPMVCVPHLHDQFDNAARCARLGASVTVRKRGATVGALSGALDGVLKDERIRGACAALSERVRREDGARRAVDEIEAMT